MANILVVDDDMVVLRIIRTALVSAGHSVETACDGHSALDKLASELFSLVIADVNMPGGLSGFNLVATMRAHQRTTKIPVMFLTGRRDKNDVVRAVEVGVDDYMVKPIDINLMLAKIEILIKSKGSELQFSEVHCQEDANYNLGLTISGVSEQGLSFTCMGSFLPNMKIRIQSKLFTDLGIKSPLLRVISCKSLEKDGEQHMIKVSFVGLNPQELQKVAKWVKDKQLQMHRAS